MKSLETFKLKKEADFFPKFLNFIKLPNLKNIKPKLLHHKALETNSLLSKIKKALSINRKSFSIKIYKGLIQKKIKEPKINPPTHVIFKVLNSLKKIQPYYKIHKKPLIMN